MNSTYYIANLIATAAHRESFENRFVGETEEAPIWKCEIEFKDRAEFVNQLITFIKYWHTPKDVLMPCDIDTMVVANDRIDVEYLAQNNGGFPATNGDLHRFNNNDIDLWRMTMTFRIQKVVTTPTTNEELTQMFGE